MYLYIVEFSLLFLRKVKKARVQELFKHNINMVSTTALEGLYIQLPRLQ